MSGRQRAAEKRKNRRAVHDGSLKVEFPPMGSRQCAELLIGVHNWPFIGCDGVYP